MFIVVRTGKVYVNLPAFSCLFISLTAMTALQIALSGYGYCQTSSTGALVGVTLDPSGALLPGVTLTLVNQANRERTLTVSDDKAGFGIFLLPPGHYGLCASKPNLAQQCSLDVIVNVAETRRLELRLKLATIVTNARVSAESLTAQTETSALGRVVNEISVSTLPLVTRNFAQIASLSPGVATGVSNAGELGYGGTALSQTGASNDGIFVHGMRSYDNNWQLDGISVSDVQGSGSASGGIPVPNPDTIQEFKVQTALYDAAYGRYAGANVSVITRTGSNDYHGTAFEFFRNNDLNANDYFLAQTGHARPVLKQNQFGFVFGGPIKKDTLLFFGSYQRTRQENGLAAGQARIACGASLNEPPLSDDRSPTALGMLFGGMTGAKGGEAVDTDGSNINPAALALLNFKLPNGAFLIPTPQTVNTSKPLATQGFSTFTQPCTFSEDQFSTNIDYLASQKRKLSARFFFADDSQIVTFPGNRFNPTSNTQGFSSPGHQGYRVFSLADTYMMSGTSINEARIGFVRTATDTESKAPFEWSDIGVVESEVNDTNEMPNLNILGSVAFASAFPLDFAQNSLAFSDTLSLIHRTQSVRLGGSLTRWQDNHGEAGLGSFVQFLSWPDFLLGLNATANGTGTFSNVFASQDYFGLFNREYRAWEGSAFVQDDYRIRKSFTLNLGLRYEHLGQFDDALGRNSSFDVTKADANPPPAGSLAGYIVASNFSGALPPGVERANNRYANDGDGQDTVGPRIGFAWQLLPRRSRLVLRVGYGTYFSRSSGQVFFQSSGGAPFALPRSNVGPVNAGATFQSPFPQPFPTSQSFPLFPLYSPTTATSMLTVSPGFRSAIVQQYSLNLQEEVHRGWLLEIGYVGTRGTHLQRLRSLNQALESSASTPIRGTTTNTVANIGLRVPILGIPADSLQEVESEGNSWYNGLEISLTKRLSRDFQFLASYTFSKTLDTDGANINGTSAGATLTLGDQNSPMQRWGRTSFDRPQRFIFSATWSIPGPTQGLRRSILGGWGLDAIATIQSGDALTIADTNSANVFGISEDRAQITGSCTKSQMVRPGPVESKLNGYFNASCFTTPPAIGADGVGTAFGDSSTGIVDGPRQANLDLELSKTISFDWPREKSSLTFRAEFYNAFNHPQFSNPDSNFTSPTFGVITSSAVNPRVGQLGLKFAF
jgi:hypothetical protein